VALAAGGEVVAGGVPAAEVVAGALLAGAPLVGAGEERGGAADIAGAFAGSAAAKCDHERTARSVDALRRVAREDIDVNEGSLAT
jgi:hypothetical protein